MIQRYKTISKMNTNIYDMAIGQKTIKSYPISFDTHVFHIFNMFAWPSRSLGKTYLYITKRPILLRPKTTDHPANTKKRRKSVERSLVKTSKIQLAHRKTKKMEWIKNIQKPKTLRKPLASSSQRFVPNRL